MVKDMGLDYLVVLLRMANISHETNVEDMVTFGISKIESQMLNKVS